MMISLSAWASVAHCLSADTPVLESYCLNHKQLNQYLRDKYVREEWEKDASSLA